MPELPEVESLRKSLEPYILNQKILNVEVLRNKIVSGRGTKRVASETKKSDFISSITGHEIVRLDRRAKNIIAVLDDNSVIIVHLKMTGQLVYKPNSTQTLISGGHPIELSESDLPNKHTYIIFYMPDGTLYYNDVRQFGYVLHYINHEAAVEDGHFQGLGLESTSENFELDDFSTRMKLKTGNLKKVFLDQKVVVGLGNIYADEVCFGAKIRPTRSIKTLSKKEIKALFEAINIIIPHAISLGGSSISDYLLADGSRGNYAREHKVYGRGGKECYTCGTILDKIQLAGRTTVFCSKCQK
jgi:formamidopyrimidine-DNA glycosylase